MKTNRQYLALASAFLLTAAASAQELKDNYVQQWPTGAGFVTDVLPTWQQNGQEVTPDDNFYISRVKPKARFRNAATQVNKELTSDVDKRIVCWLPINEPSKNALPDGVFDSEVFSMWQYVNHWGDWTAPNGRIPAALLDVAHKNGVAVTGVWGIPYGDLGTEWKNRLTALAETDVDLMASYMKYYGNDGLGYNSEYADGTGVTKKIYTFHQNLVKKMADNPIFENMWYDGTNKNGAIAFDGGLTANNADNFGSADNVASSLFFNYNWNKQTLLNKSQLYAINTLKRDPLYLYCGINMQGGEPAGEDKWTLLNKYKLSIGLWGAHERNMFWESRAEQGSDPLVKQNTYMHRIEQWFTGGTRNPANCPDLSNGSLNYSVGNTSLPGMSQMMTAKSTLSWDLAEEPFITYFNLGNGKYFNWMGQRQHDKAWYNIGVQDYLPTWRYWFASSLLGTDVPETGLAADFTWEDAYVGGSCLGITGSTSGEYLHLFKTEYALQQGDVITVTYKQAAGTGDVNLVLTAKDAEKDAIDEAAFKLINSEDYADDEAWRTRQFTVGASLAGKDLALIALHFNSANGMNLLLGEVSVVRGTATAPKAPSITKAELLAFNRQGADAKVIFNMESDKDPGEPVYNLDVKTSVFKLWAQQEGGEPVFMGITTSWAGLMYQIPMDIMAQNPRLRVGVQAVGLDMKSESEIKWSDYMGTPDYVYSNNITISKTVIIPNEEFELSYVDPKHPEGTWKIKSETGDDIFTGTGVSVKVPGIDEVGKYDLELTGTVYNEDGTSSQQTVTYPLYVNITKKAFGALPEILSLTANGSSDDVAAKIGDVIKMEYTGREADGKLSRGVEIDEKGFGFKATDAGLTSNNQAWTLSFWLKVNSVVGQFLDMRDQNTGWPQNNWGSFWSTYDSGGKSMQFTIREVTSGGSNEHKQNWDIDLKQGVWQHITVVMESNGTGVREKMYVNGTMCNPTSWTYNGKEGTGLSDTFVKTSAWWADNYMLLGFGRHQCAAIDGVVDDVKFFTRALTDAEVMQNMSKKDLTYGDPNAVWTFENDAAADHWFTNEQGSKTVKAGIVEKVAGEGEGQGTIVALAPNYTSGSPYSPGESYRVTTSPVWYASKGEITPAEGGSDQAGSASVKYVRDGEYKVKLTLQNSYGSDTRTFQVIKIGGEVGIASVRDAEIKTYTVGHDLFVELANDGLHTVALYNASGVLVDKATRKVNANDKLHLRLNASGVYVLQVRQPDGSLRQVKLLCR